MTLLRLLIIGAVLLSVGCHDDHAAVVVPPPVATESVAAPLAPDSDASKADAVRRCRHLAETKYAKSLAFDRPVARFLRIPASAIIKGPDGPILLGTAPPPQVVTPAPLRYNPGTGDRAMRMGGTTNPPSTGPAVTAAGATVDGWRITFALRTVDEAPGASVVGAYGRAFMALTDGRVLDLGLVYANPTSIAPH